MSLQPSNTLARTASWVIREKLTKRVLFETFEEWETKRIDTRFYEAVPILDYLGELNRRIQAGEV